MTLVVEISNNLITFFSHQDIFLYQSKKRKVKCADLTETKVYWGLYNTHVQTKIFTVLKDFVDVFFKI